MVDAGDSDRAYCVFAAALCTAILEQLLPTTLAFTQHTVQAQGAAAHAKEVSIRTPALYDC